MLLLVNLLHIHHFPSIVELLHLESDPDATLLPTTRNIRSRLNDAVLRPPSICSSEKSGNEDLAGILYVKFLRSRKQPEFRVRFFDDIAIVLKDIDKCLQYRSIIRSFKASRLKLAHLQLSFLSGGSPGASREHNCSKQHTG